MTAWICDVHGVLVDSVDLIRQAFIATTAHYEIPFGEQHFRTVRGLPLLQAYRMLDPSGEAAVRRRFHLHYLHGHLDRVRPCAAVADVLEEARARSIRICASTSHGEISEAVLVKTGLYRFIDYMVTQEEVRRPKPAPESILRLLSLLGVKTPFERARVLCVGDTVEDIQAGKAAAVPTAGVTYGASDESEIRKAEPDYILHSFLDMRCFLNAPVDERAAVTFGPLDAVG